MIVHRLVFFVLLFFIDLGVFLAFSLQVGLSRAFGADGTQGDHFLQVGVMASRTFGRR